VQAAKKAAAAAAHRKSCLAGAKADTRNLSGCDLSGADLTGHSLARRDLSNANLSGANLKGVIFDNALLQGVRWDGAQCPDGTPADQVAGTCEKNMLHRGDRQRPAKFGQSVRVGEWQVKVTAIQADATSNAAATADYNIEPGRGYVYAIVTLDATYEGTGQASASELNVEINGVGDESTEVNCMLMDTDLYDQLTTGRSRTFRSCTYMLASKTKHGTVRVIDGYSFESDAPSAYWTIP
jgi:hypothetical protein